MHPKLHPKNDIAKDFLWNLILLTYSIKHYTTIDWFDLIVCNSSRERASLSCIVRKKEIKLTPEEVVRQLYLLILTEDMGYPVSRMELEYEVTFGREKKRADIVIFDKQQTTSPYIIVELKKPKLKDGKEQLKSYCNATGAPIWCMEQW